MLCANEKSLVRKYGPVVAKMVGRRLWELEMVPTLQEMRQFPGRCHELKGDLSGCLAVRLDRKVRLVFRPEHYVKKVEAGLDWSAVTGIVVMEIGDYH